MSFLSGGGDDEDDFLFSSSKGGKKLADVFKSEGPAPKEKLTYDRPKPPTAEAQRRGSGGATNTPIPTNTTAAAAQPAVIYFQGVQLFKYEAGKQTPTPLGKVGAAVLQHQASNKWTLLLYYTPQKPITTTTLHSELKWSVTLQGNEHWGQLTDDAAQSWAIHFPTRDECEALSAQLALAQWCAARSEGLGVLDLIVPAKGHAIDAGDLVGLRYSAWTSAANKIGTKYESNTDKERPLRFEVGKGSVLAGLDRGVLGMKRGQRRVLVMPAALGYGDKGLAPHVTANMTLVFVVELEKMKKSGTSTVSETRVETASEDQAPLPVLPSVEVLSSSPTAAVELGTEDKAKSKLMERISKLGVPTMTAKPVTPVSSSPPHSTAVSVEPQSAVQPEVSVVSVPATPQPYTSPAQPLLAPTQPQPLYQTAPLTAAPLTMNNTMTGPQHNQMVLSSQYGAQAPMYMNTPMGPYAMQQQPNQSMLMPQPQAALSTTEMVQLLVDERQYKVELKSKIDTMSTKLEQLSEKIDAPQRGRDIGGFTPRNLLDLIQKMVLENERLTVDTEEKTRHVALLRENINQLHERNQRVVDENSKFSQERVQLQQLDQVREERTRLQQELQLSVQEKNKLQREILQLQSEKTKVEEDLASANETIEAAARKVQNMKRTQQSLEEQVATLTDERERDGIERESLKSTVTTLSGEHKKYELKIREEQTRVKAVQQELDALKAELEEERDNHQRTVRLVEENKRKYITELKKRESVFDEEKSSLEMQIEELRATLKKERTASGNLSKEQLERVEQECEHKWQAVLASREAESRQKLSQTVDEYETRLQTLTEQRTHDQHKVVQLQDMVRQLQGQLAAQPSAPISAPVASTEHASDQQWQARLTRAVQVERQRSAEDMTTAVKSIMNNVYVNLTQQFDEQAEYDTASVLSTIKRVVVQTTLEVLQRQKEQQELDASEPVHESTEEVPSTVQTESSDVSEDKTVEQSHAEEQHDEQSNTNVQTVTEPHTDASDAAVEQSTDDHSSHEHESAEVKHDESSPSASEPVPVVQVKEDDSLVQSEPEHSHEQPAGEQAAEQQEEPSPLQQSDVEHEPSVIDQPSHDIDQSALDQSHLEQSTLDHSSVDKSTLEQSTLEQSTIDQSDQSTLDQSTLDQSTLDHSSVDESTQKQSTLEQPTIDQSDQSTHDQSALEQSTLDHSAVEPKSADPSEHSEESVPSLEHSALPSHTEESTPSDIETREDEPKHDVVEVEGDLKASLDQAMLSSQYGTSTLEHSALPDERANPLEASMLPSSEETTFGERDNDLLASTLERPSSLEQSTLETSEETKESEEINVFAANTDVKNESANVTVDDSTRQSAEGDVTQESEIKESEIKESDETKESDEHIQVQQGHSIEDYKEEVEPAQDKLEDALPVQPVKTPVTQSPASRPSSAKKSLFDDDEDDDLFSKIPVKKPTPKKNALFDDDDDLFK